MTAAGRVRVGNTISIPNGVFLVTAIRWYAGKGVEFYSYGVPIALIPFMDEVEVV